VFLLILEPNSTGLCWVCNCHLCTEHYILFLYIIKITKVHYLIYSGIIGFLLCSKDGPAVDFTNPINPIEKLEGATNAGREIKFYNSEVCIILYFQVFTKCTSPHLFTYLLNRCIGLHLHYRLLQRESWILSMLPLER
jgi:hypothetical protein